MRARSLLVLLVLVGLTAAGCGGGSSSKASASASSTTSTTAARTAAFQKYRDCLKQHGVALPDNPRRGQQGAPPIDGSTPPSGPPGTRALPPGVDQQTFDAAQQACASLRPAGGFGGGGGVRNSAAFRAYASCLADHGVTVTTPPGANGQPSRPQFDRNDPHFAAANETCRPLLPDPSTTTTVAQQ